MSLILDALNKADNDRNDDNAPNLTSDHNGSFTTPAAKKATIKIGLAIVSILTIGVFLFYLLNQNINDNPKPMKVDTPDSHTTQPSNALSEQINSASQNDVIQSEVKIEEKSKETSTEKSEHRRKIDIMREQLIAKQYQQNIEMQEASEGDITIATERPAESADVSAIYQQQQQQTMAASAAKATAESIAVATPKATSSPQPKVQNTLEQLFPNLSFIGDLPYSQQKNIPTMMYTSHIYSKKRASVIINKATRSRGQKLAANLVLEEIVEDGIVLRYGTLRFKMQALNSWVNM